MKFLLVFAVLLVAFFVWRSNRAPRRPPPQAPRPPAADAGRAVEMVRCAQCGLHLPKLDAIQGRRGVYCSAQHRQQSEPS